MEPAGGARRTWLAAAGILALALLAYAPVRDCGWVWDDDANVTRCAPVQSWSGLRAIWLDPTAIQQYYPLTHTTFWIEHKAWGLHPPGFHVVNVLLHALNAILLWRALRRLGLPAAAAWIAGALFAVHPVHVESVAWVTERKNTLSMALYLGSGLLWLRWAGLAEDGSRGEGERRLWIASLGLFVLSLLAKSVTTTLPALLLVLAWWKRGRLGRRDLVNMLPFFAASVAAGLMTVHLETSNVGAHGEEWSFSPAARLLVAGRATWFYAWKLLVPVDLCFVYPKWTPDPHSVAQWLFPIAAAAVPVVLLLLRARIGRGPLATVLCWGGTLFPMLGILDVFFFRFAFVSDHFQYHASAAMLALAGLGIARAAAALDRRVAGTGPSAPAVVLALLAAACWPPIPKYRDDEALWTATLLRNPGAWMAWNNLGHLELQRRNMKAAEDMFRTSVLLNPLNHEGWNNLGVCLEDRGDYDGARAAFERSLEIAPDYPAALGNFGRTLVKQGEVDRAIEVLRRGAAVPSWWHGPLWDLQAAYAVAGRTDDAIAACREGMRRFPSVGLFPVRLGDLLGEKGDLEGARAVLEAEARRDPRSGRALASLGGILYRAGDVPGAVAALERAAAIDRASSAVRNDLAVALKAAGRPAEAERAWREALRLDPANSAALRSLIRLLATSSDPSVRRPAEAVALGERAAAAGGNRDPWLLDSLAAARAAAGRFEDAARTARDALALGPDPEMAARIRSHLDAFLRHESLIE
jgi:tetratricopeptide (TPR) repeat protein